MKSKTKRSSKGKVSVPLYRWMMFWLLVLCNVALIAALFGRVDVRTLLPVNASNEKQKIEPQNNSLVKENEELRKNLTWYQKAYSELRSKELMENCDHSEAANPNAAITYSDSASGIQLRLPYNSSWGGSDCNLPPIEPYASKDAVLAIAFGRLAAGHPVGAFRSTSIEARSSTSSAQLLASLRADAESRTDAENNYIVSTRIVNGIPVHRVEFSGNIEQTVTWYAAGRSYLFVISTTQGGVSEDEVTQIIQSLRVTN